MYSQRHSICARTYSAHFFLLILGHNTYVLSLYNYIYTYIYIYVCMRVYVYVRIRVNTCNACSVHVFSYYMTTQSDTLWINIDIRILHIQFKNQNTFCSYFPFHMPPYPAHVCFPVSRPHVDTPREMYIHGYAIWEDSALIFLHFLLISSFLFCS